MIPGCCERPGDVLAHWRTERNDMVQYFAELAAFATRTVAVLGSRVCVRAENGDVPAVVMTVEWITYA